MNYVKSVQIDRETYMEKARMIIGDNGDYDGWIDDSADEIWFLIDKRGNLEMEFRGDGWSGYFYEEPCEPFDEIEQKLWKYITSLATECGLL
jgi:hypothetical protein